MSTSYVFILSATIPSIQRYIKRLFLYHRINSLEFSLKFFVVRVIAISAHAVGIYLEWDDIAVFHYNGGAQSASCTYSPVWESDPELDQHCFIDTKRSSDHRKGADQWIFFTIFCHLQYFSFQTIQQKRNNLSFINAFYLMLFLFCKFFKIVLKRRVFRRPIINFRHGLQLPFCLERCNIFFCHKLDLIQRIKYFIILFCKDTQYPSSRTIAVIVTLYCTIYQTLQTFLAVFCRFIRYFIPRAPQSQCFSAFFAV